MAATPPLVTWAYADWRSQSTAALQLQRLKLHLQEVSGFMLESQSKGRSLRIAPDYLTILQKELTRLEGQVSMRLMGRNFGVSSFLRGGGA